MNGHIGCFFFYTLEKFCLMKSTSQKTCLIILHGWASICQYQYIDTNMNIVVFNTSMSPTPSTQYTLRKDKLMNRECSWNNISGCYLPSTNNALLENLSASYRGLFGLNRIKVVY